MKLPLTALHLDYHIPELSIPAFGRFDMAHYLEQLRRSDAEAVTLFAKDHFGNSFYPTRAGHRHRDLPCDLLGTAAAAYGLYAVFTHTGSYGVYFALFGFAAIFLFSSYNMLPTAHNNNSAIMKRADQADAAMAEYVKHYPNGSFPVPSCYAHPIVLKRMIDAVEEGQAVTTAEALDAVKARLQAVNADVQVEQEEYDEIVAIKALFLNHDYQ